MFVHNPSKRLLLAILLAATNLFSFAFGITIAGERTTRRTETVAAAKGTPAPRKTTKPAPKASPSVAPHHTVTAPAAPAPALAAVRPAAPPLPIAGKGMWIYQFDHILKGNVNVIVSIAKRYGLSHLYVRAGTSRSGLNTWKDIARLLPVAHANGLKVIAWYFPYLKNPLQDARRTVRVLRSEVNGHRVDGFAADIETPAEGTWLSSHRVIKYMRAVRAKTSKAFIVLVPPRPNSFTIKFYPYNLVPYFNAVAPMVYWGRVDPVKAASEAVSYLKRFNRPIAPIGQVYDMGPEGGPKGRPKPDAIARFMSEARRRGSVGVSFWSWQHSEPVQWGMIRAVPW